MLTAVKKSLDRADELAKSEPLRAAKIRTAVVKLYAGKAWADEVVKRAAALGGSEGRRWHARPLYNYLGVGH